MYSYLRLQLILLPYRELGAHNTTLSDTGSYIDLERSAHSLRSFVVCKVITMHLFRLAATSLLASASLPQVVSSFALSRHNFISQISLLSFAARRSNASVTECNASSVDKEGTPPLSQMVDTQYPGTAVQRLKAVHERVKVIAADGTLNGPWEDVRRRILWAGGLRDLPDAVPGQGYTGHSFNDWNHVDLTTMNDETTDNQNDGSVKGIAVGNRLGNGIRVASLPELGSGGSWSTCAMGCNQDPPNDVAHIQFRSRIAFKLVWVPNENYDTFVLVDDDGTLLAKGKPSDGPDALPHLRERMMNYKIMEGSKYSSAADQIAKET